MPNGVSSEPSTDPTPLRDDQIAMEASRRLSWDAAVPKNTVKIKVDHGRITLRGELQHAQQKTAALEDVSRLFGVAGVSDRTTIKAK